MGGWYVRRGEQIMGPRPSEQLKAWAAEGKLLATDEISREQAGPWTAVAKTKLAADLPQHKLPPPRPAPVPAVVERVPVAAQPPAVITEEPAAGPVFAILRASRATVQAVTAPVGKVVVASKSALSASAQRRHELKLEKLKTERELALIDREAELAKASRPVINAPAAPQPQQFQPMPGGYAQPVINITNVNTNVIGAGNTRKRWSPIVAFLLSFFIPGLGQLYKGQFISAVIWFVIVLVGYFPFIIPGMLLHFCCMIGAAMGDPYR